MKDEKYHLLIYQKLRDGKLKPDEAILLEDWLRSSADNRKTALEIENIWKAMSLPDAFSDDQMQSELTALKKRVNQHVTGTIKSRHNARIRKWLVSTAAVVMAAAAATHFLCTSNETKNEHLVFASHDSINQMLRLPDSSVVWFNKNSQLRYSPTFDRERRVSLVGEAYFQIQKDASRSFVVETDQVQTIVQGTTFNVRAVPDEPATEITLVEGKVLITSPGTQVQLAPNQSVQYLHDSQSFSSVQQSSPAATAWHDELQFQNTPLKDVLAQLTHFHGVRFSIENPVLKACLYTAYFPKNDLKAVLSNIEAVFECKIEKINDEYRVMGGRCME
ncbi:MAG: FecR domain-containing protein [Bacteroidetes bacterium]|nr:FecR domain-containing protein [Bacteroidota bacterium]